MTPYFSAPGVTIYHGDCRDVLPQLSPVETCITDPPYGLGFMGKGWDRAVPGVEFWQAVSDALKPGGHLLAFGGTRLWHRLAVAVEDAGFEIRDTLMWLYGSGFPKSLSASKAIDKAAGAENVVGTKPDRWTGKGSSLNFSTDRPQAECKVTEPATDVARDWQGYGTALKPAWEPILLARKPFDGTVAANIQAHGTGALNIDGCRIDFAGQDDEAETKGKNRHGDFDSAPRNDGTSGIFGADLRTGAQRGNYAPAGRWPANVALDEEAAAQLDRQSGDLAPGAHPGAADSSQRGEGWGFSGGRKGERVSTGSERERYLEDQPPVLHGKSGAAAAAARGDDYDNGDSGFNRTVRVRNDHPTVKPLDLMRWLARLTKSPHGGTVLDPFMGSGSTLVAAREEFRPVIGIELDERYCEIAARRLSQGVLGLGA